MKYILIVIALLLIFVVMQTIVTNRRVHIGIELAEKTTPYSREVEGSKISILVIGDSIAVGVGALQPELSIAGRVGETFPNASIINRGISGEKTEELAVRLADLDNHYNLIMLFIGGNDIAHFTNLAKLENSIKDVLERAKDKSDNVILATSGSFRTAKLLPFGSRTLFEYRTRKVRDIFLKVAENYGVLYVDLFKEKKDDPFARDPKKYYADDLFHPSADGYGHWYVSIAKTLDGINL